MTARNIRSFSSLRSRQGFLALLVMALLAFFGLVAGLQVLLHASAGVSSRALEFRRQRLLLDRLLEQAAREAVLARAEPSAALDASLPDTLMEKLGSLGLQTAVVESCPSELPSLPQYPVLEGMFEPLAAPSPEFLALAGPELRFLVGDRLGEYRLDDFEFEARRPVLGGTVLHRLSLEARLATVPLARQGRVAYDLPSEIAAETPPADASTSDSLGLVPSRDDAACVSLHSRSDALPNFFRHRACLAAAYQRLFSQAFVDRTALLASPTRFLDMDAEASSAPVLEGLTRTEEGVTFDLGVAGRGSWNGMAEEGSVFLFVSKTKGRVLSLVDSQARADLGPLVVVALGGEPGGLLLDLGNVARPVLLVAFNATVRASEGTVFRGAVFLSPTCGLSTSGGRLDLPHLSYWGGSGAVDWASVHASLPVPYSLEEISPRAIYAAVGRAAP